MVGSNGERIRMVGLNRPTTGSSTRTSIILGSGRDYTGVKPVTGTYFGPSPESLQVSVEVKRLDD